MKIYGAIAAFAAVLFIFGPALSGAQDSTAGYNKESGQLPETANIEVRPYTAPMTYRYQYLGEMDLTTGEFYPVNPQDIVDPRTGAHYRGRGGGVLRMEGGLTSPSSRY